jgi:hypothetical protein
LDEKKIDPAGNAEPLITKRKTDVKHKNKRMALF